MSEEATEPKAKRGGVMLTRADLDVVCAATDDPTRFVLAALHITNEATEATNAHFVMRIEGEREQTSDDFPLAEGTRGPFAEKVDLLLPSDAAREMAKALPKNPTVPILGCAMVAEQNGHILGVTTDLQTTNARQIRKPEGPFPVTAKMMPQGEPIASVALSARYLKTICDYAIKHKGAREGPAVRIDIFAAPNGPVKLRAKLTDGRKMIVALMPMQDEEAPRSEPWRNQKSALDGEPKP